MLEIIKSEIIVTPHFVVKDQLQSHSATSAHTDVIMVGMDDVMVGMDDVSRSQTTSIDIALLCSLVTLHIALYTLTLMGYEPGVSALIRRQYPYLSPTLLLRLPFQNPISLSTANELCESTWILSSRVIPRTSQCDHSPQDHTIKIATTSECEYEYEYE